jgi:hypothetical protein
MSESLSSTKSYCERLNDEENIEIRQIKKSIYESE